MHAIRLFALFATLALVGSPAHAGPGAIVPEIGTTGIVVAVTVVAAIAAIIVERRRR